MFEGDADSSGLSLLDEAYPARDVCGLITDRQYDTHGRLLRTTNPYREGQSPDSTWMAYDALDRVIRVDQPGSAITQTQYDSNVTTVKPAEQVVRGGTKREFPSEHFCKSLNEIKELLKTAKGKEKAAPSEGEEDFGEAR
jgi:hypothetical protein